MLSINAAKALPVIFANIKANNYILTYLNLSIYNKTMTRVFIINHRKVFCWHRSANTGLSPKQYASHEIYAPSKKGARKIQNLQGDSRRQAYHHP